MQIAPSLLWGEKKKDPQCYITDANEVNMSWNPLMRHPEFIMFPQFRETEKESKYRGISQFGSGFSLQETKCIIWRWYTDAHQLILDQHL